VNFHEKGKKMKAREKNRKNFFMGREKKMKKGKKK